jgi:DNA-binding NarL/FixJ family response regulator
MAIVRERRPNTPFVVLSGAGEEELIARSFREGAADYILKDHMAQLVITLHRLLAPSAAAPEQA